MFKNPRRGRQAKNFTTNVPKILDLKSSSEQIFSENWRWVLLVVHTHRAKCPAERLALRVWFFFFQPWHLNIYFLRSGSSPLVWHRLYPICDAPLSRSALHSFARLQKSRRNHRSCVWTEALSSIVFVPVQKLSGRVGKKPQLTIPSFLLNRSLPWVPEVFLACGGNFRCWPKPRAAKPREKTGNRARKSLWHPGW